MNKFLIGLTILIAQMGYSQDYQFTLVGNLAELANQTIRIGHWDIDHRKVVYFDTVSINENGILNATIHQEPGLYVAKIAGKGMVNIAVDNGQIINLSVNSGTLTASGTKGVDLLNSYERFRKSSLAKWMNEVRANIRTAQKEGDTQKVKELSLIENKNYLAHRNELTSWVENNMGTSIAVYATSSRWTVNDLGYMQKLLPEFEKEHPNLKITKSLKEKVTRFSNIEMGSKAVEITANDTAGIPISLSQFRGKYVLIDFWASWCGPCRRESPVLVRVYKNYQNMGFEIFGISLDKRTDRWVNAIKKDNITWVQVSDLGGYTGKAPFDYNITAIPSNILIDPNGTIIAYNLFGADLEEKLKEIFKK